MASEPNFIPGRQLNGLFFEEVVRPILDRRLPNLRYSAALLGPGSDVLGYDTARSTDHGWGPRLEIFLPEATYRTFAPLITAALREELPTAFRGYPTSYSGAEHAAEIGEPGNINHLVNVYTWSSFLFVQLGIELTSTLRALDWLLMSDQALLEVTNGAVYHDGLETLNRGRSQLAYYPDQVWFYLLASGWKRIAQEEPFVGRCGEAGDEMGSRIITARIVRDLMRLCFLLERRYAPYSKWLGTAFTSLRCAAELTPSLDGALRSNSWQERQGLLCVAYESAARLHNALGISPEFDPKVRYFHARPYLVLDAERFANATAALIADSELAEIRDTVGLIGGVDQLADSVDLLGRTDLRRRLALLFKAPVD
ncbi:MAG TPA: DUF4037 domain-containing protein [Candidatus Binataceae bacterium]|nr:DUF4037 domain-containing protein [Candidatus Binataceae bacterium]